MSPDGAINQDAVTKLFGKGAEEPWAVFFREVFQNSNDARNSQHESIEFIVSTGELPSKAVSLIRGSVTGLDRIPAWQGLTQYLDAAHHPTLLIADKGTSGLNGGTNPSLDRENSNFNNFFYKLGRDKDRDSGGGAYGFGRNVFFQVSETKSIFVYTRFLVDGVLSSRFMGMAAGDHYFDGKANYTGRHWWGEYGDSTPIIPLSNRVADDMAEIFAMKEVLGDGTGTAILVLGPEHEDLEVLVETLRACAEIYAWPHLLPHQESGVASCIFTFSVGGLALDPIEPASQTSPVHLHYLAHLATGESLTKVVDIKLERNLSATTVDKFRLSNQHLDLGRLTYMQLPKDVVEPTSDLYLNCGLPDGSSIALFRDAKIIVKYLQIQSTEPLLLIRGTFEASAIHSSTFRSSENLTHDEWDHRRLNLQRGHTNPVKVALDKIMDTFSPANQTIAAPNGDFKGDLILSDRIGAFLIGLTGGGAFVSPGSTGAAARRPSRSGTGKVRGSRPMLELVGRKLISADLDEAKAEFVFILTKQDDINSGRIRFQPSTTLGDGMVQKKSDQPVGIIQPSVFQVSTKRGAVLGQTLELSGLGSGDEVKVTVCYPRNSWVKLEFVFESSDT